MQTSSGRTSFWVRRSGSKWVETIGGERFCWHFRAHYHQGDEIVRINKGSARLRFAAASVLVEAGERIVVPAGIIHRFEPVDGAGWAFTSEFVSEGATDGRATKGELKSALRARVQDLLAGRNSLQTDIESVAASCSLSAGYLSRAFRRETGTSLHNFHVLLALHKAKLFLRKHAPPVEAALDAGFYDQAHLTREFVKTLGITPGTFRMAWAGAS